MKASVFIATSLDGFIARSDGRLDWLPEGGGEPHGYTEFMATVDALVIGRKTFETVLSFPQWPYGTKPVIVLTSRPATLEAPPGAMCTFMTATPAEVIDRLAARGMGHLYIDGGVTIQRFLSAGLIQRLIITRVPVVLGTGIPLFGPVAHDLRFATWRRGHIRVGWCKVNTCLLPNERDPALWSQDESIHVVSHRCCSSALFCGRPYGQL